MIYLPRGNWSVGKCTACCRGEYTLIVERGVLTWILSQHTYRASGSQRGEHGRSTSVMCNGIAEPLLLKRGKVLRIIIALLSNSASPEYWNQHVRDWWEIVSDLVLNRYLR